jgi:uncharacterized protein YjbI with pentapeptide repeats
VRPSFRNLSQRVHVAYTALLPDSGRLTSVANDEHIARLKQGVEAWNAWRRAEGARPVHDWNKLRDANLSHADLRDADLGDLDLSRADLSGENLFSADLRGANLSHAHLRDADLRGADLRGANLSHADLRDAQLSGAHLSVANLSGAHLNNADLNTTNLNRANLSGADLTEANLINTFFSDLNLASVIGLETCRHFGRSIIDYRTLEKSGPLPISFLRGVGLPERLIEYLPSIFNRAIQYYSCFISYSTKDQDFADRIHADLQNKGVRCWFAPLDMPIGAKIRDEIDAAIRLRDKLLLILSEHSIKSDWVEDEVDAAFEEESKRGQTVLFPIRLDDAVKDTNEAWAAKLRRRHIGDFTRWKEHSAYKNSFERVLRDLAPKPTDKG